MKKTFEEKLQELEKINQNLSQGDLPLERALNEFEAGISLSKECQKTLEAADKRVHILTEKDGNWEEKNYTETTENQPTQNLVKEESSIPENQPTQNLVKEENLLETTSNSPEQPNSNENLHSTNSKTDSEADSFPF